MVLTAGGGLLVGITIGKAFGFGAGLTVGISSNLVSGRLQRGGRTRAPKKGGSLLVSRVGSNVGTELAQLIALKSVQLLEHESALGSECG
jgi:hypothetical protein